jgi:uncharacterized membrane protein YgcG
MNQKYSEVEKKISVLKDTPERNPLKVASARKYFLSQVVQNQNVSIAEKSRHKYWKPIIRNKEIFPMKLAILLTILTMLFGGSGATLVAAAQTSLPDELLYPVKVWTEDIRLDLARNPETSFQLMNQFANQRFEEIQQLIESGEMPPAPAVYQWEYQWQRTLQFATETETPLKNLLIVKEQLQQQFQFMNQKQTDDTLAPFMNQFQNQIQQQMQLCDLGVLDPQQMMLQIQNRLQVMQETPLVDGEYHWQYQYQNQIMDPNENINPGEVQENLNHNQNQEQYQTQSQHNGSTQPSNTNEQHEPNGSQGENDSDNGSNNGNNNNGTGNGSQDSGESGNQGGSGGSNKSGSGGK